MTGPDELPDLPPATGPVPAGPAAPHGSRVPRPEPGRGAPRGPGARPDPSPLRLLLGLAGLASASAIASAMLPSVLPRADGAQVVLDAAAVPEPSVIHVTKVVQLLPGETPPPQASVIVQPTPTPRVHVVTTRQSGRP